MDRLPGIIVTSSITCVCAYTISNLGCIAKSVSPASVLITVTIITGLTAVCHSHIASLTTVANIRQPVITVDIFVNSIIVNCLASVIIDTSVTTICTYTISNFCSILKSVATVFVLIVIIRFRRFIFWR